MSIQTILRVQKLCKSFGGVQALNNLDLCVNEQEIVGLIGPNGSGKTTLLNLIAGALKPDKGKIEFQGTDITCALREERCRNGISRTFQTAKPFLKLTLLQNVMLARYYGRNPARSRDQATMEAKDLLDFVGLKAKFELPAHMLSLAERKRLELVRAMASHPRLLLLDEMMAGLNLVEIGSAMDVIREIKRRGIVIIMVEHIVRAVMDLSDRVVVLNLGEKIAEGSPKDVARDENVIRAYLGESYRVAG